MKRSVIGLVLGLCLAGGAVAQHRHFGYGHHHHGNYWNWVLPAVIGGAVVYGITQPPAPPQPVIVQPQLPPPPLGYHYISALDPACNCYKYVLVPN